MSLYSHMPKINLKGWVWPPTLAVGMPAEPVWNQGLTPGAVWAALKIRAHQELKAHTGSRTKIRAHQELQAHTGSYPGAPNSVLTRSSKLTLGAIQAH